MRPIRLISVALVLVTVGVYAQVALNGFVDFDDTAYLTRNETVQQGLTLRNIGWAFTNSLPPYWHPVTWLSHMLDCTLFGLHAGAHHLVSVAFHAAAVVLLLVTLNRLTGSVWRSAAVAAIFALHPLHVESVAWAAERKDVLSAFFWILAILAYTSYAKRPRAGMYLLTALAFTLGLMSKPMVVTLPLVLLLLDYWPLGRFAAKAGVWKRLVLEKLPLLGLSAGVSIVTFLMQRATGTMSSLEALPIHTRLLNALVALMRYIGKAIWPSDLSVIYDQQTYGRGTILLAAGLVLGVTAGCLRNARAAPHLLVGWLWFVTTLLPVIGLVQVGHQAIADRFMYIPMIGLAIMVAWSVPLDWGADRRRRINLAAGAAAVFVTLAVITTLQLRHWRSTVTLFERAVAVTVDNRVALNNLAWLYATHPDPGVRDGPEAVRMAQRLCELTRFGNPGYLDTLGVALARAGRFDEAVAAEQAAIEIAVRAGRAEAAGPWRARLALFQAGQAFVDETVLP